MYHIENLIHFHLLTGHIFNLVTMATYIYSMFILSLKSIFLLQFSYNDRCSKTSDNY